MTRVCCARRSLVRRSGRAMGWLSPLAPAAVMIAMPKCPACVAGWIALATGVGVSTGVGTALRSGVFVALVVSLLAVGTLMVLKVRR